MTKRAQLPGLEERGPVVIEVREHHAELDDLDEPMRLGETGGERAPGRFIGDGPTLIPLYAGAAGRRGHAFELAGVEAEALNIFG